MCSSNDTNLVFIKAISLIYVSLYIANIGLSVKRSSDEAFLDGFDPVRSPELWVGSVKTSSLG